MVPGARGNVRLVAALLLGALVSGCEGYVKRGSTLYTERRYVEAAEVFERTEDRLPESSPRQRAEYGLYRGMTLFALGDLGHAQRWLSYAADVERASPGTLREDHRAELDRAWFALRQRLTAPAAQGQPAPATAFAGSPLPQASPSPAPNPTPATTPQQSRSFLPE